MTPRRIIHRLATAGAYACGIGALYWLGRPSQVAFVGYFGFAALALLVPKGDPD